MKLEQAIEDLEKVRQDYSYYRKGIPEPFEDKDYIPNPNKPPVWNRIMKDRQRKKHNEKYEIEFPLWLRKGEELEEIAIQNVLKAVCEDYGFTPAQANLLWESHFSYLEGGSCIIALCELITEFNKLK